jgi:hypothetical protein
MRTQERADFGGSRKGSSSESSRAVPQDFASPRAVLTSPVRAPPGRHASLSQSGRLRMRAAMLHGTQQRRIDPGQSRQGLRSRSFSWRISPISRAMRIRHDYFMPQIAQQTTDPGRMCPAFHREPAARRMRRRLGVQSVLLFYR